ncbi:hypothetical protein HanRHA438_Chr06g0262211 [Helianthus annuus]|nr:hypothetical protein HanRHA438_Chr06g0262211 [Helianthus annuus]
MSRPPTRFDPFQEPRDRNPVVFNLSDSGSLLKTGSFNNLNCSFHNLGINSRNLQ